MKFPTGLAAIALAALALTGCTSIEDLPTERLASARLTLANGIPAGTVQLLGTGDGMVLAVAVTGIAQGEHGFHLHTTGQCLAPEFKSAGGHLNPQNKHHGRLVANGSHVGDMPNLMIGASGTASARVELSGTRAQLMDWLFDSDGTAIVIHDGPDDYRTDPAGAAGPRIACGVLTRT